MSNATQLDPGRENRPQQVSMAVTAAAEALGLPGKSPAARAQLLRRLEARGVLLPARRTLLSRERYFLPEDIEEARRRIEEWRRRPRRRRFG